MSLLSTYSVLTLLCTVNFKEVRFVRLLFHFSFLTSRAERDTKLKVYQT